MARIPCDVVIDGEVLRQEIDESFLEQVVGEVDNDHEYTTWVEYWLNGVLVHRSVHVRLKETPTIVSALEGF